jgi:hypothetical protein
LGDSDAFVAGVAEPATATDVADVLPDVSVWDWLQPTAMAAATRIVIDRALMPPSAAGLCKASANDEIEKILNVQLASAAFADQNVKMTWLRREDR